MTSKTIFTAVKGNILNILFTTFILFFIFNPGTKAWMLRQFFSIGLFKPEIKKEGVKEIPDADTNFSFTDASGKTTSTAGLKGKVVFINFWASWCPPCLAEMPSMDALYKKFKDDDRFVFIFINEEEDKTKAIKYLEKNNYTMPMYSSTGNVPIEIYSGSLPTTIVLDREGKVVFKKDGMAGYNTDAFIRQLKDLL